MATHSSYKQEFRIRDLVTRSVILFPTRAQIIRDIKDITLQPGQNEIVIDGLTPTVDEHSIKVEGTGLATISEVSVELLANRDAYQDIYPSDSEDENDENEISSTETEEEAELLKEASQKIASLKRSILAEQEMVNSAASRLHICETLGKTIEPSADLEAFLKTYTSSRKKIYVDHATSTAAVEDLREQIAKAEQKKRKLQRQREKAQRATGRKVAKEREKTDRRREEMRKEKRRIKSERATFWPKEVYKITVFLDQSTLTPGSSRRTSTTEKDVVNLASTTFHEPEPLKFGTISLSLSYITSSASWSPRYDLALNSTQRNGSLDYCAELKNATSETWQDAKMFLSTSHTTFSGLDHQIPILHPWHVSLNSHGDQLGRNFMRNNGQHIDGALMSPSELEMKKTQWIENLTPPQKPRNLMFGLTEQTGFQFDPSKDRNAANPAAASVAAPASGLFGAANPQAGASLFGGQSSGKGGGLFGATAVNQAAASVTAPASGLFGAPKPQAGSSLIGGPSGGRGGGLFGSRVHESSNVHGTIDRIQVTSEDADSFEYESRDLPDSAQDVDYNSLIIEEGAWEESGMTATYDVPGLRTLAPSNSTSKHKIAKIHFSNVLFSHTVVAKLRQLAFLEARLCNTSKITLPKGPLGLTLDGAFLGQATLHRCSAGESVSLPLGIDPAIQVAYAKPTVRRSKQGVFSKGKCDVFTRTITITNTKDNTAAHITILDQVPVSEDERLKIQIIRPIGLIAGEVAGKTNSLTNYALSFMAAAKEGAAESARTSVDESEEVRKDAAKDGEMVSVDASMKKGGEITWKVKLDPGSGTKLVLEYEAIFPDGERVYSSAQ